MIGFIIGLVIFGFIAGLIARALVPGKDSMGLVATTVLGIVGSFVGGFLGRLIFNSDSNEGYIQPSNIIGAIIGAIIVLLVYNRFAASRTRV